MNDSINNQSDEKSILIVDDVPQNLQLLGNILKTSGYTIAFATSGEKALSLLDNYKPDLILLDIMMPGMNGIELCVRIKSQPALKDIPVIFLTAKVEIEDVLEGFRVGAVDYVNKPVNASVLMARVNTHVALKKARDRERELIVQLEQSLEQVKKLSGLLPICASCKKIRNDEGYWEQVESYITKHSEAIFSHSICPECKIKLYPELYQKKPM